MWCYVGKLLQSPDCGGGKTELVAECEVNGVRAGMRWVDDTVAADIAQITEEVVGFCYEGDSFVDVVRGRGGVFGARWEEDSPTDEALDDKSDRYEGPEGLWRAEGT